MRGALLTTPQRAGRGAAALLAVVTAGLSGPGPASAAPGVPPGVPPDARAIAAAVANLTGERTDITTAAELAVGASTLATGAGHSCARTFFGDLWCWGSNLDGQLGVDSPAAQSLVPVQVTADAPLAGAEIRQVDAGGAHTCVVDGDGDVYCWGDNRYGQLGVGGTTDSRVPLRVVGLSGIVKVATGTTHTCALASGGTVTCWGRNNAGQLGTNSLSPYADTPQTVTGPTGVLDLAAHEGNTCALDDTGAGHCWGDNEYGQLGDGSGDPLSRVPAPVDRSGVGNAEFAQIDVGRRHACAVDETGTAYCWGDDSVGQLGDAGPLSGSDVPVEVAAGPRRFSLLDLGADTSCGTDASFSVACWGENATGQLGTGGTADRDTPTGVARGEQTPLPLFTQNSALLVEVDTHARHTCAIDLLGAVYCWGANEHGQLGDRSTTRRAVPTRVSLGPGPIPGLRVAAADRALVATWGAPVDPGAGRPLGYAAVAVAASTDTVCQSAAVTRCTVTGLSNSTRYAVFVLALSTAGFSYSAAVSATPQAAAAAGAGANLPVTGTNLPRHLAAALGLLMTGALTMLLVRRRVRFTA